MLFVCELNVSWQVLSRTLYCSCSAKRPSFLLTSIRFQALCLKRASHPSSPSTGCKSQSRSRTCVGSTNFLTRRGICTWPPWLKGTPEMWSPPERKTIDWWAIVVSWRSLATLYLTFKVKSAFSWRTIRKRINGCTTYGFGIDLRVICIWCALPFTRRFWGTTALCFTCENQHMPLTNVGFLYLFCFSLFQV